MWLSFPYFEGEGNFYKKQFFPEDVPTLIYRAGEGIWVGIVSVPLPGSYLCKDCDNPGNLTGLICSFKVKNHLNSQPS